VSVHHCEAREVSGEACTVIPGRCVSIEPGISRFPRIHRSLKDFFKKMDRRVKPGDDACVPGSRAPE
jgi:hypothetical protein